MIFSWKRFLNICVILSISGLITPALAPTGLARYGGNNPLVGAGQQNWSYPAWMAEDNSPNYQDQIVQASPTAIESTQNYLAQAPKTTAITEWQQQPRDIVRPVYVENTEMMQFNKPSSGMERFNKRSSWFGARSYFKDGDDASTPMVVANKRSNKIRVFDNQALTKAGNKRDDKREQQYFIDQQDRYAHRKQLFKDALTALLAKYSLDHLTDEEVEQQEEKILASFNRDLNVYSFIPEEQIERDLSDIISEHNSKKEAFKLEKVEKQGYPGLRNFEVSKNLSRSSKKMDEGKIDLLGYQYTRPSLKVQRLGKTVSEDMMPLEEAEEIYYRPESTKKISRKSLIQSTLPAEEIEVVQEEPRAEDFTARESSVQAPVFSSIIAQSKSLFRTDREKQIARDMIHNKHLPFLKKKLRDRNHKGMVTKSLLQSLIQEYNLDISHPDDVSYAQGALQANFM